MADSWKQVGAQLGYRKQADAIRRCSQLEDRYPYSEFRIVWLPSLFRWVIEMRKESNGD